MVATLSRPAAQQFNPPSRSKDNVARHYDLDGRLYSLFLANFYLAAAEMSFRKQNTMVFQIQLTRRQGVVPMTRDYIGREEARLRGVERGQRPRLQIAGE
jgi:hypothetical protein